ncbi:MAG TPA: alpha-L-fucosidase [Verrucomicrobiae bacterium]|nr:alpha-L-fucosidase [Verrucomicrobiae bacterium]
MKLKFSLLIILLFPVLGIATPEFGPRCEALTQWQSNRFGMFIHWGPVSLTGQEISWSRANSNTNCPNHGSTPADVYDNLYKNFNPANFNANDWVAIARDTGMKYMVLTARHGDGFLLWPSKADPYNISATPFHRDVCGELAVAAHRSGMNLGWYFSPMDWRDPDCRSTHNDRFNAKSQRELSELLSSYGRIELIWFDTDGLKAAWDPANTYALLRKLQPALLLNNRLEMDNFDEWAHQNRLRPEEDFLTPEQRIGAYDDQHPWETCMTLGTQWSWKPDDKLKTAAEVISILARTAGGDGNLLFDVGPMPDGRIEPRQVEILKQVGAWMRQNGEGIYGTRGGPWKPTRAVTSTRNGNIIYAHVLRWGNGSVELPGIPRKIKSAALLDGVKVDAVNRDDKLVITVPADRRDSMDTVVKLQLDGSAMDLVAMEPATKIKTTASNVYRNQVSDYGPQMAFDDDSDTRWATDQDTKQAWITATLASPQTVGSITISEAYDRVRKFEFQYRDGADWKTIFVGTALGEKFHQKFAPVTAREFRLNILDATQGPTINEIELSD